jgi:hypothetical protein
MEANARLGIVFLSVMTFVGCAASAVEDREDKPATRGSPAGAGPHDYTQNPYGGWGAQPAKDGGPMVSAGNGGSVGGGGEGGSSAAVAGSGGTGTSPGAAATCPSLTLARASNGGCVPRVTEYDVAV